MAKNPFSPATQARRLMKLLLYGDSGVGKTTLALTIPYGGKVALLDLEDGANFYAGAAGIPSFDVLRTRSYRDITQALDFLGHDKHDYGAVVVDPISVLWSTIVEAGSDLEKATTMRQWGVIKKKMDVVYRQIVGLPLNVTVIARAKDEYKDDQKIGVKADAEKNLPFLFDVVLRLGIMPDGRRGAEVIKDRTNTFGRKVDNLTPDMFGPILATTSQGDTYQALDDSRAVAELHYDMTQEENAPKRAVNPQAPPLSPDERFEKLADWFHAESKKVYETDALDISVDDVWTDLVAAMGDPEDATRFFSSIFQDKQVTPVRMVVVAKWLSSDETRRNASISNWRASSYGQINE